VLSVFDYQADWTWWERHPLGEEFVFVLAGELEFLLDNGDRQWSVELVPGTGVIVPRSTWHSARVPKPSTVLFITPTPARTEHRSPD
jgi:quercetin dioxygenase-like cupin family protein